LEWASEWVWNLNLRYYIRKLTLPIKEPLSTCPLPFASLNLLFATEQAVPVPKEE